MQKKKREMRLLIKFPLSLGKSVLTFMWHKLEQKTDLSRKSVSPENIGHVSICPVNIYTDSIKSTTTKNHTYLV